MFSGPKRNLSILSEGILLNSAGSSVVNLGRGHVCRYFSKDQTQRLLQQGYSTSGDSSIVKYLNKGERATEYFGISQSEETALAQEPNFKEEGELVIVNSPKIYVPIGYLLHSEGAERLNLEKTADPTIEFIRKQEWAGVGGFDASDILLSTSVTKIPQVGNFFTDEPKVNPKYRTRPWSIQVLSANEDEAKKMEDALIEFGYLSLNRRFLNIKEAKLMQEALEKIPFDPSIAWPPFVITHVPKNLSTEEIKKNILENIGAYSEVVKNNAELKNPPHDLNKSIQQAVEIFQTSLENKKRASYSPKKDSMLAEKPQEKLEEQEERKIVFTKKNKIYEYIEMIKSSGKLYDNYLLSKEEREQLMLKFSEDPTLEKVSKKEKLSKYSIIKVNGELYSIYHSDNKTPLAKGAEGVIKVGQNLKTGEWSVLKIRKHQASTLRPEQREVIEQEKRMLSNQNIFIGYKKRIKEEKDIEKNYIVMKILPGLTLCDPGDPHKNPELTLMQYKNEFSDNDKITVLINILTEIKTISDQHIVHRDLHPGNILVNGDLSVNFIDWGFAVTTNDKGKWFGPELMDWTNRYGSIDWANGRDIAEALREVGSVGLTSHAKVRSTIHELTDEAGEVGSYRHIELTPYIAKLNEIRNQLKAESEPKPKPG